MTKAKSNITKDHRRAFDALRNPVFENFVLFSCFVDGRPTAAIASVTRADDGDFLIAPLFVAVDSGMKLADHDGKEV